MYKILTRAEKMMKWYRCVLILVFTIEKFTNNKCHDDGYIKLSSNCRKNTDGFGKLALWDDVSKTDCGHTDK